MTVSDTPHGDSAFFAVFLLVLPDVLPLVHGSTWFRELDLDEPLLSGVELRPLPHLKRSAGSRVQSSGRNFVSLRFWQAKDDQARIPELLYRSMLAARVAKALNPESIADPDALPQTDHEGHEPTRTVVEAVTFVAHEEQLVSTPSRVDPLSRCIDVTCEFFNAYRVRARQHVPELTYERIHPAVLWFRRPAFEPISPLTSCGIIMLHNQNFGFAHSGKLDHEIQRDIMQVTARASAGDPFAVYARLRLEAELNVYTTGRMGESIIQCAIAAEVLFDAILGLMMWEERERGALTIEQAAETLSSDIVPRLRNEYAKRLKGNWSLNQSPMRDWFELISDIRNRVVHGGYLPSKQQASDALDALHAVEKFVGDRLAARWRTYPRSAWLFLGDPGLKKRGHLKPAEAWVQIHGLDALGWILDYQRFREQANALVNRRRQS